MKYEVRLSERIIKDFRLPDKYTQKMIGARISRNLQTVKIHGSTEKVLRLTEEDGGGTESAATE